MKQINTIFLSLLNKKGILLRAALCLIVSLVFLQFDEASNYDFRLKNRSPLQQSDLITVIFITKDDLKYLRDKEQLSPQGSAQKLLDSELQYKYWNSAFKSLLKHKAKVISVVQKNRPVVLYTKEFENEYPFLFNKAVVWPSILTNENLVFKHPFVQHSYQRTGHIKQKIDDDGISRRLPSTSPLLMLHSFSTYSLLSQSFDTKKIYENSLINFIGRKNNFLHYSLKNLILENIPEEHIKNRVIIFQTNDFSGTLINTPIGPISPALYTSNLLENMTRELWVKKSNKFYITIYLAVLIIIAISIILSYPVSVAFIFYSWIGAFNLLISIYFFDVLNMWVPLWTPLIQLLFTFILFMSFKLSIKENMAWKLNYEAMQKNEYDNLKNNFISLISHDLNTPIAKIQSITERLILDNQVDPLKMDLLQLKKESHELLKYVKTIIKLLKIESQEIKLNCVSTDLNIIIKNVYEQLEPIALQKNIQMSLHLEPMFLVSLDPLLIQEVILNITENAIKYSPENSKINIISYETDSEIFFLVEDNGIGIDKSEQNKIFEKFYRSNLTKGLAQGTGLGLYLVKYFIDLHKGKTFVQSSPGKGTSIGFSIPI